MSDSLWFGLAVVAFAIFLGGISTLIEAVRAAGHRPDQPDFAARRQAYVRELAFRYQVETKASRDIFVAVCPRCNYSLVGLEKMEAGPGFLYTCPICGEQLTRCGGCQKVGGVEFHPENQHGRKWLCASCSKKTKEGSTS
jgi:hypothetical protein